MKAAFLVLCAVVAIAVQTAAVELLLYGGDNHDVFLGSLNTNRFNANSVWNNFGTYGNRYSSVSIWNQYGTYGNLYSSYSPWNAYGSNPPVIVDLDGNFYGYFTVNAFYQQRTRIDWLVWILDNADYVFENWDDVRDELFG